MLCCRTVDSDVEKPVIVGDNSGLPVGGRWTRRGLPCGRIRCPHPVEEGWPQIHTRLTSSDAPSAHRPVDPTGITFPSPGCGRKILAQSVERGRDRPRNRTRQVRSTGLGRWRGGSERAAAAARRRLGPAAGAAHDAFRSTRKPRSGAHRERVRAAVRGRPGRFVCGADTGLSCGKTRALGLRAGTVPGQARSSPNGRPRMTKGAAGTDPERPGTSCGGRGAAVTGLSRS